MDIARTDAQEHLDVVGPGVLLLEVDNVHNLLKLPLRVRVLRVTVAAESGNDFVRLVVATLLDEPSRRFWDKKRPHDDESDGYEL
jgi:hypothetical protein